jgi:hypothetical protein
MLKTKLSTAIVLVAVLSLLLVPAAYAAQTTGQFSAKSTPPTIGAIGVYSNSGCTVFVTSSAGMTPQTEYWAKVRVTSKNKLSYLATVQATIYYDSGGTHPAPGGANTQTCAILTWHADGAPSTWTINPTGGYPTTTWTIETADCVPPADLSVKTDSWIFAFKPGKVATQSTGTADWDAEGKATNKKPETSAPLNYNAMAMNFFSEVAVTGTVDWGQVDLGLTYEINPPNPKVVGNVNYIANGNYNENIKSSATWTGGTETVTLDETVPAGNPPSADSMFALKADDTATLGSAVVVKASSATAIDITGTITFEPGDNVATNNLWLSLSAAGIAPETYTGQIFYEITNR